MTTDAQFSIANTLRPFPGFESVYQGQPVSVPIAIPGSLDSLAGKSEYDENLIAGTPVPFGSKLVVWLPTILRPVAAPQNFQVIKYRYLFVWRMRNLRDFKATRTPYHIPRETKGANSQAVLPASVNALAFESSRTDSFDFQGSSQPLSDTTTYPEAIIPESFIAASSGVNPLRAPLTPSGTEAAIQQGVTTARENSEVFYTCFQVDALGDEILILVNRDDDSGETWDFSAPGGGFGGIDFQFSQLFGDNNGSPNRDSGIYLLSGANP